MSIEDIKRVYEEAGVLFGDRINKTLDEVMGFHKEWGKFFEEAHKCESAHKEA